MAQALLGQDWFEPRDRFGTGPIWTDWAQSPLGPRATWGQGPFGPLVYVSADQGIQIRHNFVGMAAQGVQISIRASGCKG